jgi:CubicO group peptidase (beta-lactamase class C family)
VHRYHPEWKQGRNAAITIRHILGQRSGLQNVPRTTAEIYPAPDFVQLALCAELAEEPGTTFRYNNKACNLMAGLVHRIAGVPLDELLGSEVFAPLGISDWSWTKDEAGNPHAMSGLQIRPADLAKLGQLMLAEGKWQDQQVLPPEFVREAVRDQAHPASPAQSAITELWGRSYGLAWWVQADPEYAITERLLASWRESGAPEDFVEALAKLTRESGPDLPRRALEAAGGAERWNELTWQANRADFDVVALRPFGFSAEGYLGQYLVVLPEHRLVAVRMRRSPDGEFDERSIDSFADFVRLVRALVEPAR